MTVEGRGHIDNRELIGQFQALSRDTKWEQINKIDLQFNSQHPQGMVRIGDLYYISSVELVEYPVLYDQPEHGYDRTEGKGFGHLFVFDKHGELVKDVLLGEEGIYHPGGIDFDGSTRKGQFESLRRLSRWSLCR